MAPCVMGIGPAPATQKVLALINLDSGAIARGHPLGASGARLATAAVNQLHRIGGRYALCMMCIGVGQRIALIGERA